MAVRRSCSRFFEIFRYQPFIVDIIEDAVCNFNNVSVEEVVIQRGSFQTARGRRQV
jgi:hypothetical protein